MAKKRIALLYGNSGGGHRSAAEAIAQGIRIVHGEEAEPVLVNGLKNAPSPIKELVETYPQIVNSARTIYALGYHAINERRILTALREAMQPLTEPIVEELLQQNPADIYVSCHPLFNNVLPRTLKRLGLGAPFIHVVTDLVSGHVMHYDETADCVIVPTEEARRDAIANHVPIEKIAVCGQPVWPDFRQRMMQGRATLRAELGFDERPILLLMGGGDGMGRMEEIARELMQNRFPNQLPLIQVQTQPQLQVQVQPPPPLPLQLVVVCGRNERLRERLESINANIPTRILGFVKNVPELMGAADILATKAGPSTICEGFIAGLPILLYDAVPGQEEGNVDYVVSTGAGEWCPTPVLFRRQIEHWLAHEREMRATRILSSTLAKPDSAIEIAKVIGRYL
jgi:1,2-diacylglycerol 3-beta-galactosyltransferase